ncbi:hypothetical protein Tco_0284181 [Tanacetum coccineum]
MEFWPIIGDGDFVVGGIAVKKVRDSRVRLAIVVSRQPSWVGRSLPKGSPCMFVTRITLSFGLLTNAMVDALSVEPREHIFKKNYLIAIGVVMDLGRGTCCWPATRQVWEDDEVEEAAGKEVGGSVDVY